MQCSFPLLFFQEPDLQNPAFSSSNVLWVNNRVPAWDGSSGSPFLTQEGKVFGLAAKSDFVNTYGPISNYISFMFKQLRGNLPEKGWLELSAETKLSADSRIELSTFSSRLRGN